MLLPVPFLFVDSNAIDYISYKGINHIVSYRIVSYHIISYHIISYHIVSYHIRLYRIVSYHIVSYHIVSYHIVSYRIISYCIILFHIVLCFVAVITSCIVFLIQILVKLTGEVFSLICTRNKLTCISSI